MSTILDALKKLERERRQHQTKSPRSEILDPDQSPLRPRFRLLMLLATGVAGVLAGATLALWKSPPLSPKEPATSKSFSQPLPKIPSTKADKQPERLISHPAAAEPLPEPEVALSGREGARPEGTPNQSEPAGGPEGEAAQLQPPRSEQMEQPVMPADQKLSTARPGLALAPAGASPKQLGGEQDSTAGTATGEPEEKEPLEEEETGVDQPIKVIDTGRSPAGVPKVVLGMLQWSPQPQRRFAFISVDGSPFQKLREGERAGDLAITLIGKDSVTLQYESTRFVIRPRH